MEGPLAPLINFLQQTSSPRGTASIMAALNPQLRSVKNPLEILIAFMQNQKASADQRQEDELNRRAWTQVRTSGNKTSPQQALQRQRDMQMATNMAMGATMATSAPWAVSRSGPSLEAMSNLAGGWKQPGLKSKFDFALLTKDPKTLRQTLPGVPEQYLEKGFGAQAYDTLLKNARQMPDIHQIARAITRNVKPMIPGF